MRKILTFTLALTVIFSLFTVIPVHADYIESGYYNFACVEGGRYLNVYAGWDWDGVNVCVWDADGSPEQKFKLVERGTHHYVLYPSSSASGRVLDANRGSSWSNPISSGNNIDIWQTNDAPAQEWYIDDQGGGKYKIGLASNFDLALTCDNPWANNGNVSLQTYTGAANQLWYLKRIDGGISANSGNLIDRYRQIADSVGNQNQNVDTKWGPCGAFCIAYARTFFDNTTHYYWEYYWGAGAQWRYGGGTSANLGSDYDVLMSAKSAIDNGKPAIIHVSNQWTSMHYVLAISYSGSGTSTGDFTILDPQDGQIKSLNSYNIHWDKQVITF